LEQATLGKQDIIPDDGGSTHLWNVGRQSFYTAVQPRRQLWTKGKNITNGSWGFRMVAVSKGGHHRAPTIRPCAICSRIMERIGETGCYITLVDWQVEMKVSENTGNCVDVAEEQLITTEFSSLEICLSSRRSTTTERLHFQVSAWHEAETYS
jgi:hypothetical protein